MTFKVSETSGDQYLDESSVARLVGFLDENGLAYGIKQNGNRPLVMIGPVDPISDIPVIMSFEHHQVHEGESYQVAIAPAALSSGSDLDLRFVVGNQVAVLEAPHLLVEVDATAETWVYLYETPTTTTNGTQQTARNRQRGSTNAAMSTVWLAPTVTNVGTLLSAYIIGAGNKTGGATRESAEWNLNTSTVYLIRVTSKAAGNNVCVRVQWYEDLGV